MASFADVVIPVAINKAFTYLVPPDLQGSAVVGTRVVVPFGRHYVTGLVVHLPEKTSLSSLKPIRDVLDGSPVVSPELLDLCRWIATYYFAPLGEVLKTAIPHGFASVSKRRARLAEPQPQDAFSGRGQRKELLSLLQERGPMLTSELQKALGIKNIHAVLNNLEKSGHIITEEVLRGPKTKARLSSFVNLSVVDFNRLEETLAALPHRKQRARRLLETARTFLQHNVAEIRASDLLKQSGTAAALLREFSSLLPVEEREVSRQQEYGTEERTLGITLNASQSLALKQIIGAMESGTHRTLLLHGITGSGKTQVYIEAIRQCLERGNTAIVMVPEISLTPQIVRRFKSHFGEAVAVVHSRLSAGERHDVWRLALRGTYRVVIGPRSAVFTPLTKLGLIVVDEEHEPSYKQFDATPRYHGRDTAIMRGALSEAVVLLGSATPSTESYHNASSGKYDLIEMPTRIDNVPMPQITIVDMTGERKRAYAAEKESLPLEKRAGLRHFRASSISRLLQQHIGDRLARREGTILLQNRRGFAPYVECLDCGHIESCDNCSITLTYHLARKHLRCHYCGDLREPPDACPECRGTEIELRGIGTQRVEQELAGLFPDARIVRMDLDTTTRKGAHDRILKKFGSGEADILLGTQMVAKGLDFDRVTLVGVISADTQMLLPEFRAAERTFQLLTQVAGRAGRSTLTGEVIIQTHQPDHYTLQHVLDHDFKAFHMHELETRRELTYPPFSRIVLVETKGKIEARVRRSAERLAALLSGKDGPMQILGPAPAVIEKIKGDYRWHIIIKNPKSTDPAGVLLRRDLQRALTAYEARPEPGVRVIVDVDPVGML